MKQPRNYFVIGDKIRDLNTGAIWSVTLGNDLDGYRIERNDDPCSPRTLTLHEVLEMVDGVSRMYKALKAWWLNPPSWYRDPDNPPTSTPQNNDGGDGAGGA